MSKAQQETANPYGVRVWFVEGYRIQTHTFPTEWERERFVSWVIMPLVKLQRITFRRFTIRNNKVQQA